MHPQAAQERQELQAAGDALDAQISKAEAECGALEGTLGALQATNSAFSASLRGGEDGAAAARAAALRCVRGCLSLLGARLSAAQRSCIYCCKMTPQRSL